MISLEDRMRENRRVLAAITESERAVRGLRDQLLAASHDQRRRVVVAESLSLLALLFAAAALIFATQ